jgi:hypothetical protein
MPTNTKGRNGGDRATPKFAYSAANSRNHTSFSSRLKVLIVHAACWGYLPGNQAQWMIQRLHLENS